MDGLEYHRLAYLIDDEDEPIWRVFMDDKHEFRLEGDESGGYGFVLIRSWGDTFVSWG